MVDFFLSPFLKSSDFRIHVVFVDFLKCSVIVLFIVLFL